MENVTVNDEDFVLRACDFKAQLYRKSGLVPGKPEYDFAFEFDASGNMGSFIFLLTAVFSQRPEFLEAAKIAIFGLDQGNDLTKSIVLE